VIGLRGLLLVSALILLAVTASRFELRTDITHFMPAGDERAAATIASELTDSQLTRSMVLSVEGPELDRALQAARALEGVLREHPQVAWVRSGVDPEQARRLFELYFPLRHAFLSDRPDDSSHGVAALVSEEALRERAVELRHQLSLPAGTFLDGLGARDPLGAFTAIVERVRGTGPGLEIREGQFVSRDGQAAILLLATSASAFDTSAQAPFLADLSTAFAGIAAEHGAGLVLEQSGVNRYAVRIEEDIQGDVVWIMGVSFVGVTLLFLAFFGSPRAFGFAILPAVYGILTAAALCTLIFGRLDALTVGFSAALIGVAIDYSVHLMTHHVLDPTPGAAATARRLRPSLLLGAGTTMASFTGMALTSFPGFREMGVFAILGVGVAVLFALLVLPRLLTRPFTVPPRLQHTGDRLAQGVARLDRRRGLLWSVPALSLALGALALPSLQWSDDISSLSELDPGLVAEDERVRGRVSRFDASRFVLVTGRNEQEAVARNDAVHLRLEQAKQEGALEGMRSLHSLLWSEELQRRNLELVHHDADLPDRLDRVFEAEGFRPGAFGEFRTALAEAPPAPLDLATLRDSGMADMVQSLVVGDAEGELSLVTYLRGVHSEDAVRDAVAEVPGARLFDQCLVLEEIYGGFRTATLRQIGLGSLLVVVVLLIRYRRIRPALAAFLPSLLTAWLVLSLLSLFRVELNLMHVVSLVMVMGMGVDYGIFVVDSALDRRALGATMLSLVLSCLTTVFVFGTLGLSSHPALRSMGVTTSLGIALSLVLAPVTLAWLRPAPEPAP
jgi:predicted exporter